MAYTPATITDLLKKYFEPGLKEQFFNNKILLNKIKKNRSEIHGGQATVGLHTTRNVGIGSRANAGALPTNGNQGYAQSTIPLKYHYGRTWFSGPDIANSKSDKGAFARIVTANLTGMMDDMQADINRQLFSDGSGILALDSTTDTTTTNVVYPYVWDTAAKYLPANTEVTWLLDTVNTATTLSPLDGTATANVVSSVTGAVGSEALAWTGNSLGTMTSAGNWIGRQGSLQYISSSTFVQREMMGLMGIVHDSNLIGDDDYVFDTGAGVTVFTNPAGASYNYSSISGATNELQGIDAAAAANSYWKAKVMGNGGVRRALSLSLMDQMWGSLVVTKGAKTDLILTTYQVQNKYADLLRQDRRYVDTMTLDGGFKGLAYNGVALVADQDCPEGQMFFLDTGMLSLYVGEDFGYVTDASGNSMFNVSGYDIFEVIGRAYMNLGCHCRNRFGRIADIQES